MWQRRKGSLSPRTAAPAGGRFYLSGYMEEGNRLCSLVMAPSATSTLYAWTSDGLFRTDDAGETWSSLGGEGLVPKGSKPFNMSSQLCIGCG